MGLARSIARNRATSSWTISQTPSIARTAAATATIAIEASAFLRSGAIRHTLHVSFALSTQAVPLEMLGRYQDLLTRICFRHSYIALRSAIPTSTVLT